MPWFLLKTEPSSYSIDDLEREATTTWDGVRNPQAVKTIRSATAGDRVFLYHSGGDPGVVGIAEVTGEPRPDPANPSSAVFDLRFVSRLPRPISLKEIKASGLFEGWALVRQGRLSVVAVPDTFVTWLRQQLPGYKL